MTPDILIERLRGIVGADGLIVEPDAMQPYLVSWRDDFQGKSPAVVRPRTTQEVAAVVRLCAEMKTPIVPQGGRTGLTGASQPSADRSAIVLTLERMNRIRAVDTANDTMMVEAGCVLDTARAAADAAGRLLPLSFGASGSCHVGGIVSTNAGGINVVRYGNTRNLVTGLEVVLPDGQVWEGLRGLRKDNAGYDLKQLFIGAEGTLGIVTAAVLRLVPRPRAQATAFVAVPSPAHALAWFARAKDRFAEQLTAFELIQRLCVDITCRHIPGLTNPVAGDTPWYVLIEVSGQTDDAALAEALEALLADGFTAEELTDGTIAASGQQREMLWRLRESIPEAHKAEGASFKHDISVPISRVPDFLDEIDVALPKLVPGVRMFSFGHVGDGNLHVNPLLPPGRVMAAGELQRVNALVHDAVAARGGSISAEHGIGLLRREELVRYKSPVELAMMIALKRAFDPENLMNPGKILSEPMIAGAAAR